MYGMVCCPVEDEIGNRPEKKTLDRLNFPIIMFHNVGRLITAHVDIDHRVYFAPATEGHTHMRVCV